jgi:hypothetical protein
VSGPRFQPWRNAVALVCCVAVALFGGTTAAAPTDSRQTAEARFVEQRPGVPTALTFNVDYHQPDDPDAKPPAVQSVIETLAQGARFDTSVPAQCAASDAQLMAQGEAACAPDSKVGTGYIRIDTGFPDPNRFIEVDVAFLNNADQLIFLTTDRDTGAHVVARSKIEGGQITSSAPPLPGTPPDGGALDVVTSQLDSITREIQGEPRAYITTPPDCPPGGEWVNSLSFTYRDGVTQQVESRSACAKPVSGVGRRSRCANRWQGGEGADRHSGTAQGDRLIGSGGDDSLGGGRGADCLHGNGGADVLRGGPGRDRLIGGRGDDRLIGGPGRDTCDGGPGRDRLQGCEPVVSR